MEPFAHHYNMQRYIVEELPSILAWSELAVDLERESIFGHSMGGHGAITLAPIAQPTTADWSRPAFEKYLGADEMVWRPYDATLLIEDGYRVDELLVDQGTADPFLETRLRPKLLQAACAKSGIPLTLNMRDGYDHSYFFISTFMADHIRWHAARLG